MLLADELNAQETQFENLIAAREAKRAAQDAEKAGQTDAPDNNEDPVPQNPEDDGKFMPFFSSDVDKAAWMAQQAALWKIHENYQGQHTKYLKNHPEQQKLENDLQTSESEDEEKLVVDEAAAQ